jgi:hypothetical protein
MTNRSLHGIPQADPRDELPTPEESCRAALHERQVSYVRASLLRGISYEPTGESARIPAGH